MKNDFFIFYNCNKILFLILFLKHIFQLQMNLNIFFQKIDLPIIKIDGKVVIGHLKPSFLIDFSLEEITK